MKGEYHHKFKVPAAAVYDAFYFSVILRCYNYVQGSKLFEHISLLIKCHFSSGIMSKI